MPSWEKLAHVDEMDKVWILRKLDEQLVDRIKLKAGS